MNNFRRPHDDIYNEVGSMDILDVYQDAQVDPQVNSFLKTYYFTMRDPQYLEWRLNNDTKVTTNEMREDILRNKLEAIKRCERMSLFLDEHNIGLATYKAWCKKFNKKSGKSVVNGTIPEWVRSHSKKCQDGDIEKIGDGSDEVDKLVNNEALEEMKARKSMLKPHKKEEAEKKPRKVESKD
ncbi:hypothetical protein EDI_316420 [Entamoeba dispar SAW760]|uniref:Uncharacterized protein n=1 Tax=Entamoeba dispar (strain ATCC PRA-260 / SAW760) TaxID=370354 RepID=B0E698_ENTDS|nr:uncharacterized protein EDI_316420 [Entamoeba dispar SAW760]EDR29944.1 hypothetical protein EDI_316420 [Entamoeba dispar SAW760]|eukprot:EDR29944.1 hypothetical protein EDI_316420 [Entamoeba dispar SAW760]